MRAASLLPVFIPGVISTLVARQADGKPPPGLTFLYSLNCTLGESFSVGDGPFWSRTVIPIVGGWFEGPRVKGEIINLGADWAIVDKRGVFHPDTRYGLRTDDGANIYVRTFGSAKPGGGVYLHGLFETGAEKYWWMNDVVAVGELTPGSGWVFINMYHLS